MKFSGNPGYLQNQNLLIASRTDLTNSTFLFEQRREGFHLAGRAQDNTCQYLLNQNNINFHLFNDPTIIFNQNLKYSCNLNLNYIEFENFCNGKLWKSLVLYNIANQINYIGIFGNANINNINDWIKVINIDYNLEKSTTLNSANNTCWMPSIIVLEVLYSKTGVKDPVFNYVVSARLSAKYK